MKSALLPLFLTSQRRALTSLTSLLCMVFSSVLLVHYIDLRCDSPAVAFSLILAWACLLAALSWLSVMALSPLLIVPSVLEDWARDPWRDEQVNLNLPELDDLDPRRYRVNPQGRFKSLYALTLGGALLFTHLAYDGFLTRFQREGARGSPYGALTERLG